MIELCHVTKSYGPLRVVDDLSIRFPAGKITVLAGPSGCGKTTTLEMINGLVRPDAGEIVVGGENIARTDLIALRRRMGYVIQEIGLFPHYTVFENIAIIPRLLKWEEKRIRQRVDDLRALINIPADALDKYPAQLSGGQQQRVGVARALAADPDYLLMDEPFSAIDPINRARLQDEFLRIQQKLKKTVLFVTHDMDEALKIGDHIAVMYQGMIVQFAPVQTLLSEPANDFVREFIGEDHSLRVLRLMLLGQSWKENLAETPTIAEDAPLSGAREIMEQFHTPYIFAVDADGRYRSYLRRRELSKSGDTLSWRHDLDPLPVGVTLHTALNALLQSPIGAMPVVDSVGKLIGHLTFSHIQQILIQTTKRRDEA